MSIQHFTSTIAATGVPLDAEVSPAFWSQLFTNAQSPQDKGFTASPSGGIPPYTYSWQLIGASGLAFVGGTTGSSCTIRASGFNSDATATLRVTVNDSGYGSKVVDAPINVTFEP